MKLKQLISKLQKLEKTESGEVSFKIASPNWAEGDQLNELNLVLLENAEDVFTEIIFEKHKWHTYSNTPNITRSRELREESFKLQAPSLKHQYLEKIPSGGIGPGH